MSQILITGGTGLIGRNLSQLLHSKGFIVTILSRTKTASPTSFYWDIDKNYIDPEAIIGVDYIIHLAGAGIADKRWTTKRKKHLIDSRVKTVNLLFEKVKELNPNLKGFISASGTGYYGTTTSNKIYSENDNPGNDFLTKVCQLWEAATSQFDVLKIRTVVFRTGIVLSKNGGAFTKMSTPIKLGFGAIIGTGKQYMPWIHINDLCQLYLKAIEDSKISGIYNAVAPEHINNSQFTKILAKKLNKSLFFPKIPAFILKLLFGKMAIILLEGSRVSSNKIEMSGYKFEFPTLNKALKNILNSPN